MKEHNKNMRLESKPPKAVQKPAEIESPARITMAMPAMHSIAVGNFFDALLTKNIAWAI